MLTDISSSLTLTQKIDRSMTIFTIYNMIQNNNYVHPLTMKAISDADINRAKELIELYTTNLGMFKNMDETMSAEFRLIGRLTLLFKKFHIHSVYLEENWLMGIDNETDLEKIMRETELLVSNNIKNITSTQTNFRIFSQKPKSSGDKDSTIAFTNLKEYIVDQWEQLIKLADNAQNQVPMWIIISGLSFVVPEIKTKYPDLEIIMG